MSFSEEEEYRQNAQRCEAQAEQLEGRGAITLAGLYREMASHWRQLAKQIEQSRF